jgi:hypothetical protein
VTTQDHNVFAGAFVDRSGERRKDPDWLDDALDSEDSRFVPVWGDQCFVGGDPMQAQLLRRDRFREIGTRLSPSWASFRIYAPSARYCPPTKRI